MAKLTVTKVVAAGALSLGLATGALAEEIATGKMLVDTCAGCHGTNGNSVGPASPSISAMDPLVFVDTMIAFQEGDTYSTIMGRIAKGYSSEEITQLADHYAALPFEKAIQTFDAGQVKKGAKLHDKYCEKCHAEGGQSAEDDAGVLAGQWVQYTRWQMDDFQAGSRKAPKKMAKQVKKMLSKEGTAGIDALLNYYASQQK